MVVCILQQHIPAKTPTSIRQVFEPRLQGETLIAERVLIPKQPGGTLVIIISF